MHCCILSSYPYQSTDSNTSVGMIWVTLNMSSAAEEYHELDAECCRGVPRTVSEFHIVCSVVILFIRYIVTLQGATLQQP